MRAFDLSRNGIASALRGGAMLPSSDYDLNPGFEFHHKNGLRAAAVLIPIIERRTGPHVILTMRASALAHHPGQIAFPGGKVDAKDADPQAAALREAFEEIGLHRQQVEILGRLPNHETVTSFDVHPFVGRVRGRFQPVAETGEVEEIFEVPLSHLIQPRNFLIQSRNWSGHRRRYYTVPYGPYYIWGATARILRTLASGLGNDDAG
jgi:8-oxo-dGTP pyrophosphatase MutT (NUDIX family)